MSKETKALEADLTARRNDALRLREKIADLGVKLENDSFAAKPARREEIADLGVKLTAAESAVAKVEGLLPRARALDDRAARIASFRDVDARAVTAGKAARASVVTAVRALSEACALGKAAGGLAVELGGHPSGFAVSPDAIDGIDQGFFERLSYGSEVEHLADVRFPIVSTMTEVPAPGRRSSGGLVSGEETAANRAADLELALRK